ncbi:hypothetical protein ACP4OV_012641 [Aristida adscensionis]
MVDVVDLESSDEEMVQYYLIPDSSTQEATEDEADRRSLGAADIPKSRSRKKERASTSGMSDAWSSMVRDILAKVDYLCEKMDDLRDQVNDNYKLTKLSKKMKKDN